MKEKILSSFPYLLLAIFFIVIFSLNSKTQMTEPVFSIDFNNEKPAISTEISSVTQEITKSESENTEPEKKQQSQTQIIEAENDIQNAEQQCFYTKNGTKYHLKEDCRYLKNSSKLIKTTVDFAIELGLDPCSGCRD